MPPSYVTSGAMRILVVEDQIKLAKFIKNGLEALSYSVDLSQTGASAEALVSENEYDLVILDIMLPDQSGLDTARHLRAEGFEKPILMLTALSSTRDKVHGLDAGADDYLTKPFEFDELAARIRALLRRNQSAVSTNLTFCDLNMDLAQRKVERSGKPVGLTTKEFALLEFFLRHPNHVLSRASISEHVWDAQFDSESNVIDVYVNMLRKKVDQPFPTRLIHTVVGVGYVLRES